jgi:hypothetical protein
LERPSNDRCSSPELVLFGRFSGASSLTASRATFEGNSLGAWPRAPIGDADACGVRPSSRGLYYLIEATSNGGDRVITVEIFDFTHALLPNGRFEVAIFSTGDASNQHNCDKCVMVSDYIFSDGPVHTMSFTAKADTSYTVLVGGETYADVGTFTLEFTVRLFCYILGGDYSGWYATRTFGLTIRLLFILSFVTGGRC